MGQDYRCPNQIMHPCHVGRLTAKTIFASRFFSFFRLKPAQLARSIFLAGRSLFKARKIVLSRKSRNWPEWR